MPGAAIPGYKEVIQVLGSAARTADSNTPFRPRSRGGLLIIDVTADPAAASVTFTWQGVTPDYASNYTILASAAITGTGQTILRVHTDLTAAANTIAKDMLPEVCNLNANHVDTDSMTYSVTFLGCD